MTLNVKVIDVRYQRSYVEPCGDNERVDAFLEHKAKGMGVEAHVRERKCEKLNGRKKLAKIVVKMPIVLASGYRSSRHGSAERIKAAWHHESSVYRQAERV